MRIPHAVAEVRSWVLYQPQAFVPTAPHRICIQMDTVRHNRTWWQRRQTQQTIERIAVSALFGIFDIGQVFGDMDVHHRSQLATELTCSQDRFIRNGKACAVPQVHAQKDADWSR